MAVGFVAADAAIVGAVELSMFSFNAILNVLFGGFFEKISYKTGHNILRVGCWGWAKYTWRGSSGGEICAWKSGDYYLDLSK